MSYSEESQPQKSNCHSGTEFPSVRLLLSIVVPIYNEEDVLPNFHDRLKKVLDSIGMDTEIVYVNDGSTDGSLVLIEAWSAKDHRIAIVDLSRNFGKEIAMTAGLDHAKGDGVVVIDADLQDPPELIPDLVKYWLDGFDNVFARRERREGEGPFKKLTSYIFYRVIQRVSRVKIPEDTGDYRLLSRRALEALKQLREQHRFMKGLFAWVGYQQVGVSYKRDPRFAGKTKWNYLKLWNLAVEGITSFTIAPLKVATYLGLLTAAAAFIFAGIIIFKTLLYGDPVAGYPSLMVVILFLGGIQLITIGIIGEYLGRMFDESKNRPLYLLNKIQPSKCSYNRTIENSLS